MDLFLLILSSLLIVLSVLPFINNQHWCFRVPEFMRLHIFAGQILLTLAVIVLVEKNFWSYLVIAIQTPLMIYHAILLFRFSTFYKKTTQPQPTKQPIKVISTNIYQFNTDYQRFIDFINKHKPDVVLTIESNAEWQQHLQVLEKDYPHNKKIALENTYGMHFYSKIPVQKFTTHYFVADDIPSIEAHLQTSAGEEFVIFAVHPPPPSPSEETTSKERDGDLLCIAKRCKEINKPIIVIGDFNTVAWSKITALFRKNSGLIDGRVGRGILASFHAKYWFFRIPLDLVFHSPTLRLHKLSVLENVGSDHFPIYCEFTLDNESAAHQHNEKISTKEQAETEELIEEGKQEESDNR